MSELLSLSVSYQHLPTYNIMSSNFLNFSISLTLAMCVLRVSSLAVNNIDSSVETLSSPIDLNAFFAAVQSQNIDSSELRQSVASTTASTPTTTAPAASPASSLTSIISGLLTALGSAITPALGPLAPFATAVGPLINNALSGLLTSGFNSLGGILKRDDLPNSNFETIILNIPNQGSYILMIPKPEIVVAEPEAQKEPTINYNINNLFQLAQQMQQQQKKQQEQIKKQQHMKHDVNSRQQELLAQFRKEMMMMPLNQMTAGQ